MYRTCLIYWFITAEPFFFSFSFLSLFLLFTSKCRQLILFHFHVPITPFWMSSSFRSLYSVSCRILCGIVSLAIMQFCHFILCWLHFKLIYNICFLIWSNPVQPLTDLSISYVHIVLYLCSLLWMSKINFQT